MASETQSPGMAPSEIGVYTHPEAKKSLEAQNEPQGDALKSQGYVFDEVATKRLATEREKAIADAEKSEKA